MPVLVLLSDRSPGEALPALDDLAADLKHEPLDVSSLPHVVGIDAGAVLVDACENAPQAWTVVRALRELDPRAPAMVILARDVLERYPWHEVVDEFVFPGAAEAELRVRFAMLRRRAGAGDGTTIRLGPMAIDTDTYRVTVSGRPLDLTFKEFELVRYLAERPGRVLTRPTLLREVWGYDFYGGTRTVDVHIRRLRAKVGPEHEHLIETVRGVGYRAADPGA
jgi:DNA-binding response OmpR family regulator